MEQQNLFKERITLVDIEDKKQVLVDGKLYMSYKWNDEESARLSIVQLYENKIGTREEIAKAFRIHKNTVRKYISSYEEEGLRGILTKERGPVQPWKLTPSMRAKILEAVFRKGTIKCEEIARIIKEDWGEEISDKTIRRVLIEDGVVKHYKREKQLQVDFFKEDKDKNNIEELLQLELDVKNYEREKVIKVEDSATEIKINLNFRKKGLSYYSDMEREYLNKLERGKYSSYGAGLLFVPMLKRYKFLDTIKEIIKIDVHEGYKLEQLALTLFYFSLFEFRSIEDFKSCYSDEFGMLIGKINSPSIFTLRRFLHEVRELKKGEELTNKFGENYIRLKLVKYGKIYIDEHFLPYYGIEEITKGYYTVRDRVSAGSYNFIAVDEEYSPLIFIIRESSEDLIKKIPELIEKIKEIGKAGGIREEEINKITVIFDRGGFSAELFRKLNDEMKIKFITWAKNIDKFINKIEEDKFKEVTKIRYKIQKSKEIKYYEEKKNVNKYGKMRAIIIKRVKDEKVGVIYTNDDVTDAAEIIQIMCTRWGEENFIKAMKLDYRIDYMPGYVTKDIEEQPMVENPLVEELKQKKKNLISKLNEYSKEIGEEILEKIDKGLEEIKIKELKEEKIKILADIAGTKADIRLTEQEIEKLPEEIRYDKAYGERLVKFDYEKKRFLDCIKMFSYMMEKQMCEILMEEHIPPKEVWTVLEMITRRGAEIKLEDGKLRVKIKSFRDGAVEYAALHLCKRMNEMEPRTLDKYKIPMYYEVE